jgi:hypothetical protein
MFGFTFHTKDQLFYTDMEDSVDNKMLQELKELIPVDKLVFDYNDEIKEELE